MSDDVYVVLKSVIWRTSFEVALKNEFLGLGRGAFMSDDLFLCGNSLFTCCA